jgi:hypothetical protein
VTLPDYPSFISGYSSGLPHDLLQALGHLSVVSARLEQLLHKIYWKHAGLNEQNGPIVTDILNPKRLFEDILKFANLDPANEHIVADLRVLSKEFEDINTKRNRALHWIWAIPPNSPSTTQLTTTEPVAVPPFKLLKPAYKQTGEGAFEHTAKDVVALCNDCAWLETRLTAHSLPIDHVRAQRAGYAALGAINAESIADICLPAPWLDKPLSPKTTPPAPSGGRRAPQPPPQSSSRG